MFGEDPQLQELLPEEHWEEQQPAQPAAEAAAPTPTAGSGDSKPPAPRSRRQQQRQERREARAQRRQEQQQRRQRRGEEVEGAEGPLTETDSDDNAAAAGDASSMSSSGSESEGSTSSGTSDGFEQYDVEESDEEDPARSKLQVGGRGWRRHHGGCSALAAVWGICPPADHRRPSYKRPCLSAQPSQAVRALPEAQSHVYHVLQLRDLPKMLLSKAEEDWRGQLRALRHAEYLIRAAPDELEQYAGGWVAVRWLEALV